MSRHDLVVIGAGPGGYVAAIRAAQLGLNVGCIDKNSQLGGTCLRIGCIPSKALLESSEQFAEAKNHLSAHGVQVGDVSLDLPRMLSRKDRVVQALTKGVEGLFRKHNITRYQGHGQIEAKGKIRVESEKGIEGIEAENILIATGSQAASLPGVEWDGNRIGTSTEALAYPEVPEHLVVVGAGYIGLEMGTVWNRLGSEVTVLEYLDRILPGTDTEIAEEAQKIFKKQGLKFRLGSRVTSVQAEKNDCVVECEESELLKCDRVLVAVGRRPNTNHLGLDSVGVETDEQGFIDVNESFETSVPGIYAIGDVIGGALLAHKAEDEGIACVEELVSGYGHVNYDAIPSVVYTHPEIAAVGKTEDQLQEENRDYRKGMFPFIANGRARALGQTEGRIKILADRQTDRVLGVHIIGPRAGDLIPEATAAIEFCATSEDLARCSHPHPSLSEALREAAFAVDDRPLHI